MREKYSDLLRIFLTMDDSTPLIEYLDTHDCSDLFNSNVYGVDLASNAMRYDLQFQGTPIMDILMEYGLKPDLVDNMGKTIMHNYVLLSNSLWSDVLEVRRDYEEIKREYEHAVERYNSIKNRANMYYRLGADIIHPDVNGVTPMQLRSQSNRILQDAYIVESAKNDRGSALQRLPYMGALRDMLI